MENLKEGIVTVKMDPAQIKRLDSYVKKMKIQSRSQLIRNMIDTSLEDLDLMNTTGMLTMAIKGYDLLEIVKKALGKKNFKVEGDNKLIIDL